MSESRVVASVGDAIIWAKSECRDRVPAAAGIDTLLHWSESAGGWRPADRYLRLAYPVARSSVQSPNGLRGSMAAGGMALALRLRECWPDIVLNETHPKVLFTALSSTRYSRNELSAGIDWFFRHSGLHAITVNNDHEFDAIMSAWATHVGIGENWQDLVLDDGSLIFPAGNVRYLWPRRR